MNISINKINKNHQINRSLTFDKYINEINIHTASVQSLLLKEQFRNLTSGVDGWRKFSCFIF